MIGFLQGKIITKTEKSILIDVQGVGYEVAISTTLIKEYLAEENIKLYIHTKVAAEDITLFGFATHKECLLFRIFLNITGIGPRTSFALLDIPVPILYNAILTEDVQIFTQVPGIGKKTAERILFELKDKHIPLLHEHDNENSTPQSKKTALPEDVIQALEKLGYKKINIIKKFLKDANAWQKMTEEEMVTWFLKT